MTYTLTQVLDTLDAVVADFGADYVQEQCVYRTPPEREYNSTFETYDPIPGTGGEPVCIVAQVLARLDPDLLTAVDNETTWDAQDVTDQFEPAANHALNIAQQAQDGRLDNNPNIHEPWGRAVEIAKEAVA